MTATGLNIAQLPNSKSHQKNSNERVTRIEVFSEKCVDEPIYEDVTLDTAYKQHLENSLVSIFI